MQTQTSTSGTAPASSLADMLLAPYARNHESMEEFPLFVQQWRKTRDYLHKNPTDIEKQVYLIHLLSEVGATSLVVKHAVGIGLAVSPIDPFLLYSAKVALRRVGKEEVIAQYDGFQDPQVLAQDTPGPSDYKVVPLPKKHWWSKKKYTTEIVPSRAATFGEIEFLAAHLDEQTW